MAPYQNPIVLVTRPKEDATAFVAQLQATGRVFEPAIAPAFGIEALEHNIPTFDGAIFTSKAGVATAPEGMGRVAWCVGDVTATAAAQKGYAACSARGNADALVVMILGRAPSGTLVHLRGENSYGDVSARLTAAGLTCREVVTYRKVRQPPPEGLGALFKNGRPFVLPVFSAETGSILRDWQIPMAQAHIVAISTKVADTFDAMQPFDMTVVETPNLASMTQAVARLIA